MPAAAWLLYSSCMAASCAPFYSIAQALCTFAPWEAWFGRVLQQLAQYQLLNRLQSHTFEMFVIDCSKRFRKRLKTAVHHAQTRKQPSLLIGGDHASHSMCFICLCAPPGFARSAEPAVCIAHRGRTPPSLVGV